MTLKLLKSESNGSNMNESLVDERLKALASRTRGDTTIHDKASKHGETHPKSNKPNLSEAETPTIRRATNLHRRSERRRKDGS